MFSVYLFKLCQFKLQPRYFRSQLVDSARAEILIHHAAVLDVPRSVCVFQRVKSLHEVAVARRYARYHNRVAVTWISKTIIHSNINIYY